MYFRLAKDEDVQQIFEIVKAAYNIELGNSGVAFKNANRYIDTNSVIEDLPFIWVLRDKKNDWQGKIIGCIKGVVDEKRKIIEIGPVAVRPDYQVRCIIHLQ